MTSAPKKDAAGRDLSSDGVFMVARGLLDGWVCAPNHMTQEDVQASVDRDVFPSGTSAGWRVDLVESDDPQLVSPGPCAEDCDRRHWYLSC